MHTLNNLDRGDEQKPRVTKAKKHKIWTSPDPKSINKMIALLFKMIFWNIFLHMVKYIPWTQGMCNEVVYTEPSSLAFIPDHFKKKKCAPMLLRQSHTRSNLFLFILERMRCLKEPLKNIYTP